MRKTINSLMMVALCAPHLATAQMVSITPLPPIPVSTPLGADPQMDVAPPRAEAAPPIRATIWVPPTRTAAVQAQLPAGFVSRRVARPLAVVAMREPALTAAPSPAVLVPVTPSTLPVATRQPLVAAPIAAVAFAAVGGGIVLPSNTDVLLRLDEEVSSKRKRVGDKFRLTVVQDVMLGGYVIIPRGTPAFGAMTYRTGKGVFGKSAKIEIDMENISLAGRSIPVAGHFRQEGRGNTGATIGVAVAAGLIAAAFVTGRSAVFEQGREFRVSTREAVPVTLPDEN